ncbi:MAG: MBL fold metallo-hydrolase [Thermodesulfobacteriota bacterium]
MDLELLDIPFGRPGFQGFLGAWLVRGTLTFLVDTGPSNSAGPLIKKLKASGLNRVDYVLITHIHLDHAGGLSRVLEEFPGAGVVCHRKAVPHLVDPAGLWAGSRKVLGEMADAFGPPAPVPKEVLIPHDEAGIPGLRIIETRGHAPHHISFSYQGCLFAGEAAGNYIGFGGRELLRPATPPRFYLEESLASVDRMRDLEDQLLCYAHFGKAENSRRMLGRFRDQLLRWRDILASLLREHPDAGAELCLKTLLRDDPELESFSALDPAIRDRERFFMVNSIHGYLGYLKEAGI